MTTPGNPLNLAAGNEFATALSLSDLNTTEMTYAQKLRALDAEAQKSAQIADFNAGISVAESTKKQTMQEVKGEWGSAASSFAGGAISAACVFPVHSLLPSCLQAGPSAEKEELENLKNFEEKLKNPKPSSQTNNNQSSNASLKIDQKSTIEKWIGTKDKEADVSGFKNDESEDALQALFKDDSEENLAKVRQNVRKKRLELESHLYNKESDKKQLISQMASSFSQGAAATSQAYYNTCKSKDQLATGEYQAIEQIMGANSSAISSNEQNEQQAANNFQQDALAALNLNTQAV